MFKAGIIDPAKVTRSALQNAASIAALFLTTEAVIAEKPEKDKAPAAPVAAAVTWTSPPGRPRRRAACPWPRELMAWLPGTPADG
jgi:hypothetical protein